MSLLAKKKKPFTLGNIVKDEITGMKGTASSLTLAMSGTEQCHIIPLVGKGRGDKDFGAIVDLGFVTYVSPGTLKAVPVDDTSHLPLGAVLRDKVTGFVGTAVFKTIFLSGCTQYSLQPTVPEGDKTGKLPDDISFDWKRLEVVDLGLSDEVPQTFTAPKTPTKEKRPGGPIRTSGRVA
jgi:hypothetical protein